MSKFTKIQLNRLRDIATRTPEVLPFVGDTPQKRNERIRRVMQNNWHGFSFFSYTYMPHIFDLNFTGDHREMFEVADGGNYKIIVVTGFRGLGKTVLLAIAYSLWRAIKKEPYIIHAAADAELAKARTALLYNECANNLRLLSDFPMIGILSGIEEDFYLRTKCRIQSLGIMQQIKSSINPKNAKRPGLIFLDDIDKEVNIGNQSIGRKKMDRITGEVLGALNPHGKSKIIWLGNLTHPNFGICQYKNKLVEKMQAADPTYKESYDEHIFCENVAMLRFPLVRDGVSAWEDQYPTRDIPQIQENFGSTSFQREMQGIPVIEGNIFKENWFKRFRIITAKPREVILRADPAWGTKGAYKCIDAIMYADDFNYYVLKMWLRQTTDTKFFRYYYDAFCELQRRFAGRFKAYIETCYGQERIKKDFSRWCKDNNLADITMHIRSDNVKTNKNVDIERLETPIETSRILLPEGQDSAECISQFCTYPQGYIDGPDNIARTMKLFASFDKPRTGKVRSFGFGKRFGK